MSGGMLLASLTRCGRTRMPCGADAVRAVDPHSANLPVGQVARFKLHGCKYYFDIRLIPLQVKQNVHRRATVRSSAAHALFARSNLRARLQPDLGPPGHGVKRHSYIAEFLPILRFNKAICLSGTTRGPYVCLHVSSPDRARS